MAEWWRRLVVLVTAFYAFVTYPLEVCIQGSVRVWELLHTPTSGYEIPDSCQICGRPLEDNEDCVHVVPWEEPPVPERSTPDAL